MHDQTIYWIWLNEMRGGITLREKRKLLSALSSPENIFHEGGPSTIADILETKKGRAGSVADSTRESYGSIWNSRNLADAEAILANNEQHSIHLLSPLIIHTTKPSMKPTIKHHWSSTTKADSPPHLKYPSLVSSGRVQAHPTATW